MGTNGRSEDGRYRGARVCAGSARVVYLLAALGLCLGLAPSALASAPSFTWTGGSTASEDWSEAENWAADSAPADAEKIGTLTFPRLTSPACTAEPREAECYFSYNDLKGLAAESMQIDDGDEYEIGGEALTVGKGGLGASPSTGSSGQAWDYVEPELHLSAPQKWAVAGRGGSPAGANGLLLVGALSGASDALTVELSKGAAFYLENETEVGSLTIDGPSATKAGFENGVVALGDGELNSEDRHSVELSHILFSGEGEVGPLTTKDAEIDVGERLEPAGSIEASSVRLDSGSKIAFEITGSEMLASLDYSQLVSEGEIELGDSTLAVEVGPPWEGEPCPELVVGQTYTFVSTSGTLSGSFGNAPEDGPDIPITFAESCGQASQEMRIDYYRSGGTETVTGTVESKPVVSEDPVSVKVSEGSNATFTAAATGAASVQWQVKKGAGAFEDDTSDQGVTSDALTVEHATGAQSGDEYRAVFENHAGETPTTAATLTVEARPAVSEDPVSVKVSEGSNATFTAAATGAASVRWQLKRGAGSFEDDTSDQGVTSDTLTVEHTTSAQSGDEYRAVFENDAGETPTTAATLTVETAAEVKAHEEEAARIKLEGEAAANKHAEEVAAGAAAKKRQEEEAKTVALGIKELKEGSPEARIASASLIVSRAGALVVKVECPSGEISCTGTITLRTLKAVLAGVPGREAKPKAAVLTLATGSFTVAGGHSKALTLDLSQTARKLLARSHVLRARAIVVAHNPAGATHTDQAIVTLRTANSRHGKG